MAVIDPAGRYITAKLVYYGPGLCGKTTNLQWIHQHAAAKEKGELASHPSGTERTLHFDLVPVGFGAVQGMQARLALHTAPGPVHSEETWRRVLRGADAVVFVVDSQPDRLDANRESLRALGGHLESNGQDRHLPVVLQYNKRDLPGALAAEALQAALNPGGHPVHESVATRGIGVEETLRRAAGLAFERLAKGAPAEAPSPGAAEDDDPPLESLLPAEGRAARGTRPRGPAAAQARRQAPTFAAVASPAAEAEPASPRRRRSDVEMAPTLPTPDRALAGPGWLLLASGARQVPLSFDELLDEILSRGIEDSAMVWGPGLATWSPARAVPEIAPEIPPPLPGRAAPADDEGFPDFATVPEVLRTVLIADEDPSFRNYLAMPLRAQGFTVVEADDGERAWELTREQRPWLILSDVSLPGIDGFELCRRVRAHSMTRQTPIVFISGLDDYKERYRGLQLGADDFLSKGTPIRELLIRIQLILTRYTDLQAGTPRESGMDGEIEMLSAPGVLQICHQGRFSGTFTAVAEARRRDDEEGPRRKVEILFRDGDIVGARSGARTDVAAVYEFLGWTHGHFAFVPGDVGEGDPIAQSVEHLLLEGCRILDEERRDEAEAAPS